MELGPVDGRETLTRLAQEVLDAKVALDTCSLDCDAKVQAAKDAANAAVQVAEEARHEWDAAHAAYQAKKAELQATLAALDEE